MKSQIIHNELDKVQDAERVKFLKPPYLTIRLSLPKWLAKWIK